MDYSRSTVDAGLEAVWFPASNRDVKLTFMAAALLNRNTFPVVDIRQSPRARWTRGAVMVTGVIPSSPTPQHTNVSLTSSPLFFLLIFVFLWTRLLIYEYEHMSLKFKPLIYFLFLCFTLRSRCAVKIDLYFSFLHNLHNTWSVKSNTKPLLILVSNFSF